MYTYNQASHSLRYTYNLLSQVTMSESHNQTVYLKGTLAILHNAKSTAVSHLSQAIGIFHSAEELYVSLQDDVSDHEIHMDDCDFNMFSSDGGSDSDTDINDSDTESD